MKNRLIRTPCAASIVLYKRHSPRTFFFQSLLFLSIRSSVANWEAARTRWKRAIWHSPLNEKKISGSSRKKNTLHSRLYAHHALVPRNASTRTHQHMQWINKLAPAINNAYKWTFFVLRHLARPVEPRLCWPDPLALRCRRRGGRRRGAIKCPTRCPRGFATVSLFTPTYKYNGSTGFLRNRISFGLVNHISNKKKMSLTCGRDGRWEFCTITAKFHYRCGPSMKLTWLIYYFFHVRLVYCKILE